MAYYSQKRRRSLMTSSRESTYSSPAVKRPRTDCVDAKANLAPLSRIESLPTEILQLIFFASLNGNFLRSAPRIAAKLSGSRNIYRTAFFVAFYHPYVLELRDAYRFNHLLLCVETPIPSWEIRSMQKVVLDSRWCTYGWYESLASELLTYAYNLYRNTYAVEVPSKSLERLDQLQRDRKDLLALCDRASGGNDAHGQYIELVIDPFNLSINVWPAALDEDSNEDDDNFCEKARRWHLQLQGIGSIPLQPRHLKRAYDKDNHFRLLVNEIVWNIPCTRRLCPAQTDIWECLETSMLHAVTKNQVNLLQDLLEINYFFWPEDAPFKLSPRIFIAAARQFHTMPLYLLFQVDPNSLPRSDQRIRYEAKHLGEKSAFSRDYRSQRSMCYREEGEEQGDESLGPSAQLNRWQQYKERVGEAIDHYVRTGCLMREVDPLSPVFFLHSRQRPVQQISNSKSLGCGEERWLSDEYKHVCDRTQSVEEYEDDFVDLDDCDDFYCIDDGTSWDEAEDCVWPETVGLDMPSDSDTLTHRAIPPELDITSILANRGEDLLVYLERKEDYHYMMP